MIHLRLFEEFAQKADVTCLTVYKGYGAIRRTIYHEGTPAELLGKVEVIQKGESRQFMMDNPDTYWTIRGINDETPEYTLHIVAVGANAKSDDREESTALWLGFIEDKVKQGWSEEMPMLMSDVQVRRYRERDYNDGETFNAPDKVRRKHTPFDRYFAGRYPDVFMTVKDYQGGFSDKFFYNDDILNKACEDSPGGYLGSGYRTARLDKILEREANRILEGNDLLIKYVKRWLPSTDARHWFTEEFEEKIKQDDYVTLAADIASEIPHMYNMGLIYSSDAHGGMLTDTFDVGKALNRAGLLMDDGFDWDNGYKNFMGVLSNITKDPKTYLDQFLKKKEPEKSFSIDENGNLVEN